MFECERLGHTTLVLQSLHIFLALDSDPRQDADRVVFDLLKHFAEHLERFAFVFLLGVFLCVTAKTDALAQVVHCAEVFLPVKIELLQHDFFFDKSH